MIGVGDRVVCVNDEPCRNHEVLPFAARLVLGRVYTVRAVNWHDDWEEGPGHVLDLFEAPCPGFDGYPDGWDPERFRKVQKADDGFIQHMRMMRPKAPAHKREDA